ncbi:D-alanine--D-alanine ligase [Actinokineospora auranticolor]|uniref:D-alanine--D-alanine ligase n=1 Tax=Actinokineospora auranticolor TaxID=155976 RepID=A0A2S6GSJ1_9PSEU|nr:D-alanine--D-alanine ligase [Actinokineospora auranticolor]PPK68091.1 D-alanine-D-alanine ligase [Actinokineospora auranticolor]
MSDRWVAVLAGGLSHERDVSLRSGRRVSAALRSAGVTVEEWDADAGLLPRLRDHRPDAVVIAMHGGEGENGSIQTILDLLDIPYVGADPAACRRAWDKPSAKADLRRAGLQTPDWVVLPQSAFRELGAQPVLESMVARLGLPLMLKPDQGGSALGAQVVRSAAELPTAMVGSLAYSDAVLAEEYIDGVEVAVPVIEDADGTPRALPAVEIVPESGVYDYTARYTAGLTTFHTPARIDDTTAAKVAHLAVSAHRLLGLRDVSRTDAVVSRTGEVHFIEVSVSPGLTETSLVPIAIEADGGSFGEIYAGLVDRAIARSQKR